jgi:hypothetical protein
MVVSISSTELFEFFPGGFYNKIKRKEVEFLLVPEEIQFITAIRVKCKKKS